MGSKVSVERKWAFEGEVGGKGGGNITNRSEKVEFDILAIDFELRGTTAHG